MVVNQTYYANTQGRFTSANPLAMSASPGSPQSWNRYAYVGNNPLTATDPTGMMAKGETPDYTYRNKDNAIYGSVESGSWKSSGITIPTDANCSAPLK